MSEETNPSFLAGIDKALLIAFATPFAYFIAFQYDKGYLGFFGVPDVLVDVSLRDLVLVAAAASSFLFTLYTAFESFFIFLPDRWPQRLRGISLVLFLILVAIVIVNKIFEIPPLAFVIAVACVALVFAWLVAIPLRKNKKATSSGTQLEVSPATSSADPFAHKGVVPEAIRRGISPHFILGVFWIVILSGVANLAGGAQARMQTEYFVHQPENGAPCAIIRMRDSDVLCASFNAESRQLSGEYLFLKPDAAKLSLRETGRLNPPQLHKKN